ncbi:hypothetical protein F5Y12DRAFT_290605 [Xylaria sp. FL1777]|nr:hypothetical protein F5Y12DRAFT_290605 [Xylaria sp. FL1777]
MMQFFRTGVDNCYYSDTREDVGMAEAGYCTDRKCSKFWYAAFELPSGGFESIGGIYGSSSQTSFSKRHIPVYYRSDKREQSILGWERGYENGGLKVNGRGFPVFITVLITVSLCMNYSPDCVRTRAEPPLYCP